MKITASVFSLIIIFTAFTGCSGKKNDITPVTENITFTAELTYYNECYEGNASLSQDGSMHIELLSPEELKGLSFDFDGEQVTAEFSGLKYNYTSAQMPEGAVCTYLYDIFSDIRKGNKTVISDKSGYYIYGNIGKSKYKLLLGATGLPISVDSEASGFSAVFKNVTVIVP